MSRSKRGPRLRSTVAGTTLLGIALPARMQTMVTRAIPVDVHFRMVASLDELARFYTSTKAPLLIYALPETSDISGGSPTFSQVFEIHEALRGSLKSLPAAALCSAGSVDARLVATLRTLDQVHLVTLDAPDPTRVLWTALERLLAARISEVLYHAIGDLQSALIRDFMAVALCDAGCCVQVPDVARQLHMHERTLRRRLREEEVSLTPQELIGWARMLLAAWHLRERERPVADIANALSFSAASNLHRAMKAYTGVSVQMLRHGDPVALVADAFRRAVCPARPHRTLVDDRLGPESTESAA